MKLIFVLALTGLLVFTGITGCTPAKNSTVDPAIQSQADASQHPTASDQDQIDKTKIRNTAFQWLKNQEAKVKEWETAQVIETKYTDDHNVYKADEIINIEGMDTLKVVFEMEDNIWGSIAIAVYVDKATEEVLGMDPIAR
ncbi:MAG: hypothetical protein AAGU75_18525 [Bacillota bacterium]